MASAGSTQRTRLVESIEERTTRRVGIDVTEDEAHGKFNEQSSSPLFSVLPRELRDLIWELTTAPFEDSAAQFEETAYYYRPGHTARLTTDTAVLLTCRRVWLEANALPMLQAEHSFYYLRAAPDRREPQWMANLTEHNRQNFGHLHLFAQMSQIEGLTTAPGRLRQYFLKTPDTSGDFQPKTLHITIRHTDWWYWESETPLRLKDGWVRALLNSPDLRNTQTVKLELETLDYKVDQLQPIVERIKGFESEEIETHLVDGKQAKTKFVLTDKEETYSWEGPANINNKDFVPYAGKSRLKYHVVTLTWKLRFPEMPNAFVPELRRRPRVDAAAYTGPSNRNREPGESLESLYTAQCKLITPGFRTRTRTMRRRNSKLNEDSDMQRYLKMRMTESQVRYIGGRQADMMESAKRRRFQEGFGKICAEKYMAKWEAHKSLLKFVE